MLDLLVSQNSNACTTMEWAFAIYMYMGTACMYIQGVIVILLLGKAFLSGIHTRQAMSMAMDSMVYTLSVHPWPWLSPLIAASACCY